MGMVRAFQKGELKNPSDKIRSAASSMDEEDVKHFAATKHKGLPERKEAFLGPLLRGAVVPAAYGGISGGSLLAGRKADQEFAKTSPGALPPSQMSPAQLGSTPMTNKVRGMTEASSSIGHMLDADLNTFMASNPGATKLLSPLLGVLGVASGQPLGDIAKRQAHVLGPGVAAGLAIKRWLPGWKMPGLAGTVGAGVGAGLGIKGSEIMQRATGLEAPVALNDRINESWWRPQLRGLSNTIAGAAGGFAGSKNPVGAVGGAIAGAMKEPMEAHRTLSEQNANIAQIENATKATQQQMLLNRLADPRVPLDSMGDLNALPTLHRDAALTNRYQAAASGQYDTRGAVKPRSTWKDMNTPEYHTAPAPATPLIDRVGNEVSKFKLPATSRHAPVKTPSGPVSVPGTRDLQFAENLRSVGRQLPLAGGILAGGLGLWGLRKLFEKEKEDKPQRSDYVRPSVPTPDRWVIPSS